MIGRVGAPHYTEAPTDDSTFMRHNTLTSGAPIRVYMDDLRLDILDGTIVPSKVFDRTVALTDVADGYRAMADREPIKVLIQHLTIGETRLTVRP